MSKAEFVVHQDDVGRLGRGLADADRRQPLAHDRIGLHQAVHEQRGDRVNTRTGEVRHIVLAVEALEFLHRRNGLDRIEASQTAEHAGRGTQPAHPEGIEAKDHDQRRNANPDCGQHHRHEPREDREQEGDRVRIDDHQVDEVRRRPDHLVLELRDLDQGDNHGQRKRARNAGPAQQHQPEEVERAPGQDERAFLLGREFGRQHNDDSRHVENGDQGDLQGITPCGGRARCGPSSRQICKGGRHGFHARVRQ